MSTIIRTKVGLTPAELEYQLLQAEAVEVARQMRTGETPKLTTTQKVNNVLVAVFGLGGITVIGVVFMNVLQGIANLI